MFLATFPIEIVTPYVKASLTQRQSETGSLSCLVPIFECKFDGIQNGTYVYDVFWFINGFNVTEHKNIPFIDLGSTVLKDAEWTNSFSMNMEVIIIKIINYNFLFSCRYLIDGSS